MFGRCTVQAQGKLILKTSGPTPLARTFGPWVVFSTSLPPSFSLCSELLLFVPGFIYKLHYARFAIAVARLCALRVPFDAPNIPGLVQKIAQSLDCKASPDCFALVLGMRHMRRMFSSWN